VEKCEEAKHSPPRRATEDAQVTTQHDVPRWASGRWQPTAIRLLGWSMTAAPVCILTQCPLLATPVRIWTQRQCISTARHDDYRVFPATRMRHMQAPHASA